MDLGKNLVRMTARAFYSTECAIIIDALVIHSTLTDSGLANVLRMREVEYIRRLCRQLNEDGLISIHSRGEREQAAAPATYSSEAGTAHFQEHIIYRDWYYIDYHRAIDSIKYRTWRLSEHIRFLHAPSSERKDLVCSRCSSSYAILEVMDNSNTTGDFLCNLCQHVLDPILEDDRDWRESESMKRLNNQISCLVDIMRQIDITDFPETEFDMALSHALSLERDDLDPAREMQLVEVYTKPSLSSSRGLTLLPEEVFVSLERDSAEVNVDLKVDAEQIVDKADQNALPEWISRSTITSDDTAIEVKKATKRGSKEAHGSGFRIEHGSGRTRSKIQDDNFMDAYWAELQVERNLLAMTNRGNEEEEDEHDEDSDVFEDVDA